MFSYNRQDTIRHYRIDPSSMSATNHFVQSKECAWNLAPRVSRGKKDKKINGKGSFNLWRGKNWNLDVSIFRFRV